MKNGPTGDNFSQSKYSDISDLCSNTSLAASVYSNISLNLSTYHTADVERTSSQLKLIKTSIRNRMNENVLYSLLHVVVGRSVEEYPIAEVSGQKRKT